MAWACAAHAASSMRWAEYGPRVRFIAIPPRRICVDHPGLRVRQRETQRARPPASASSVRCKEQALEQPSMELSRDAVIAGLATFERELDVRAGGKLNRYFPATGPYRRALYPKYGYCQVDENRCDRPTRYCGRSPSWADMLGIRIGLMPQLDSAVGGPRAGYLIAGTSSGGRRAAPRQCR